ncbi:MAG: glycosyltransferase 87 family protein [Victivallaceae bacterium]
MRIVTTYRHNALVDFICYLDCTMALLKGLDCYKVSNLVLHKWDDPLIVYPGMTLYFIPWTFMNVQISALTYYILTVSVTAASFVFIFKITGLLQKINFRNPDQYTLFFFISGVLFINSSPVMMCLRHGQSPTWIILGILLFFYFENSYAKILTFGLIALMKYSMITILAPLLFVKKYYAICIYAFIVFVALSLYLVFCGFDPIQYYLHYIQVLSENVDSGYNSFAVSGYNMLQIEFFRANYLNIICKLFFAALSVYILFIERKREGIGLNLLLLTFCISMLLCYHRFYDAGIIVLLLLVKMNFLFKKKDWSNLAICSAFCLFYLIPLDAVLHVSNYLGSYAILNKIFYTCTFKKQYLHLLPVLSWSVIALTGYTFYLYKKTDDDFIFDLDFIRKKQSTRKKND